MTIALDLGASALRSLRVDKNRLAATSARAVYSVVDDSPARRQMLDQLAMPYAICDAALAIPGDAAYDLAELFHVPVLSLLPGGALMDRDAAARQMLASLLEAMIPGPSTPQEICGVTLPGVAGGTEGRRGPTAQFLLHVLKLRGFDVRPLNAGTALVLAELVADGFTGIGISLGAAACHVSLVHRSMEIASCTIPRGGSWIDQQLAATTRQHLWDAQGNRYLDADAMCRWKESDAARLDEPGPTDRDQSLVRLYTELLTDVVKTAGEAFQSALMLPESWPAMTVVACGGPTHIAGFVPLFANLVREAGWPVRVKQVRLAEDADFTIARGCLIHAELNAESSLGTTVAA